MEQSAAEPSTVVAVVRPLLVLVGMLALGVVASSICSRSQRWLRRRKRPVLKARVAAGMQRLEEEVDAGGGGVELEARNGV